MYLTEPFPSNNDTPMWLRWKEVNLLCKDGQRSIKLCRNNGDSNLDARNIQFHSWQIRIGSCTYQLMFLHIAWSDWMIWTSPFIVGCVILLSLLTLNIVFIKSQENWIFMITCICLTVMKHLCKYLKPYWDCVQGWSSQYLDGEGGEVLWSEIKLFPFMYDLFR